MKLTIISSQMTGVFKALSGAGLLDLAAVRWVRQPVKIDGMWRCIVIV